jgi:hypothetical protein
MTEKAGDTSLDMRQNLRFPIGVIMLDLFYIRYNISELTDLKANHELQYA